MLVHHVKFSDGRIEHLEFTRDSWEWALKATEVVDHWGHHPARCRDPLEEIRERQAAHPPTPAEEFVPRAMLIEQKREQIRKILEESRPGQLSLGFDESD